MRRVVHVRSPCEAPAKLCLSEGEDPVCETCTDGVCLCIFTTIHMVLEVEEDVEVEEFVPRDDTTSPVMALLGDGRLVTSSDGTIVMIHQVGTQSDGFPCKTNLSS